MIQYSFGLPWESMDAFLGTIQPSFIFKKAFFAQTTVTSIFECLCRRD
jgi:hypothetical protein